MSFKKGQSECFVYITLPGRTAPVTAGKFVISISPSGLATGRFRYGKSYLAREAKVPLDPVELVLSDRTYSTTALRGVFGALRDASPDYWGRCVIDRQTDIAGLGEMDYLLHSPDDRAGALGFGIDLEPLVPKHHFNPIINLARLQTIADAIINNESIPDDAATAQVDELMLLGTSMGGARPKAVVEDGDGLWLAKFNRPDDRWNQARVEHAMLTLARECDIRAATSRIVEVAGRDVLLVKRFDREKTEAGYLRHRMVSGLTLLRADDAQHDRGKWSYPLLVEELRRVSAEPREDARELFSRMCFNAMISNSDDHPRNHALIAPAERWHLAPAYDLTPSTPISTERRDLALVCGDAGRYANAENLLSQCARFLLTEDEARARLNALRECIENRWYTTARSAGVSEADCEKIRSAFLYEGFFYDNERVSKNS
ncbi:MAG: type II toxin-antitoxin system HipA family toxin [Gammaproteobacteria bacterium]|nr:MAG: type II toxin-antitoxin system HipA family toxin [Gammaproteobacteria bacterium]